MTSPTQSVNASRRIDNARATWFRKLVNEGRTLPSALLPSAWKPLAPSRQFCCQQCPLSGWRSVDSRKSRAEDPSLGQSEEVHAQRNAVYAVDGCNLKAVQRSFQRCYRTKNAGCGVSIPQEDAGPQSLRRGPKRRSPTQSGLKFANAADVTSA